MSAAAPLSDLIRSDMQPIAAGLFAGAVLHTFAVGKINAFATRWPKGSAMHNLLHFFGEIEVVFGLWAAALIVSWSMRHGTASAVTYMDSITFTEAMFVFCVMTIAATKPILRGAEIALTSVAVLIPLPRRMATYCAALILGPLLGSLITEPAAMTVTAIFLRDKFFRPSQNLRFKYVTLGLLFVNISIGGSLTHFAAPPVLMVAGPWGWDTAFMLKNFGFRAILAVVIGSVGAAVAFRKELSRADSREETAAEQKIRVSPWILGSHLFFLAMTILEAHHPSFFIPMFMFFLGWHKVTEAHQSPLRMRESLLVAFFLGGLVTLGGLQDFWLRPLLAGLDGQQLFVGATMLTAITDNAALTYLGTLVPDLSEAARYSLVAGALAGGGLTVIANAPNPAGYGILSSSFGEKGINPLGLLLAALPFTALAMLAFFYKFN